MRPTNMVISRIGLNWFRVTFENQHRVTEIQISRDRLRKWAAELQEAADPPGVSEHGKT